MSPPLAPVRLVVPLGPNPAALTESTWSLCAQGHRIDAVVVVLESTEAEQWLHDEVLGEWGAWASLHAQHPGQVPAGTAVQVRQAGGKTPDAARFAAVLFEEVLQAQSDACDVVVTLSGGRWRGSTAIATTIFQLLARGRDRMVDVRLDEPMAEGATGFYFPTQSQQKVLAKNGRTSFTAAQVSIDLRPIRVPRLRPFLNPSDLTDYETALLASENAIQAATPPRLKLDIAARKMWVNDIPVPVSAASWPYYVRVVMARKRGEPGVPFSDLDGLKRFLEQWEAHPGCPPWGFLAGLTSKHCFRKLLESEQLRDEIVTDSATNEWYRNAIAVLRKRLLKSFEKAGLSVDWLVPQVSQVFDGQSHCTLHAIKLDAERIELVGDIQVF